MQPSDLNEIIERGAEIVPDFLANLPRTTDPVRMPMTERDDMPRIDLHDFTNDLNQIAFETLVAMDELCTMDDTGPIMRQGESAITSMYRPSQSTAMQLSPCWEKVGDFGELNDNNGDIKYQVAYIHSQPGAIVSRVSLIQYNDDDLRLVLQSTSNEYDELVKLMLAQGTNPPESLDRLTHQLRVTAHIDEDALLSRFLYEARIAVPEIELITDEIVKTINKTVSEAKTEKFKFLD